VTQSLYQVLPKICPAILELNHADRYGQPYTLSFRAHNEKNAQQRLKRICMYFGDKCGKYVSALDWSSFVLFIRYVGNSQRMKLKRRLRFYVTVLVHTVPKAALAYYMFFITWARSIQNSEFAKNSCGYCVFRCCVYLSSLVISVSGNLALHLCHQLLIPDRLQILISVNFILHVAPLP
jgi:hypothetical protein